MSFHTGRQVHWLPPIANHHNIQVDLALVEQAGKTTLQIVGPVAHCQDDGPKPRQ
jgi:hypothetical protein